MPIHVLALLLTTVTTTGAATLAVIFMTTSAHIDFALPAAMAAAVALYVVRK